MDIAVLGANHETAPVAVRERIVLDGPRLEQFYATVASEPGFEGAVAVSTCNRTEVYWAGVLPVATVLRHWEKAVGVPADQFSDDLYLYTGERAVEHLFRVAAGLDSMMLGETQILGQVKDAYQAAQALGAVGHLHRLFLAAIRAGKRAHRETAIGAHAVSMGYAGVELVRKIFGDHLQDLSALVVGAGEMGRLAARHLKSAGVGRIWVANRTRERATALALELGGAPVLAWDQLAEALQVVDLVVASTSAPEPVVTAEDVRRAVKARRGRPLMFLDLAVPRDVEPGVEALAETVFRYDIDDLALVVAENRRRRQEEVRRVEEVIGEEQRAFRREMEVADIAPVIRRLREKAEGIRQQELAEAWRQLGHLSDHDRAVVDRTTRLILNKLLNDPMISIRGWAGRPEGSLYLDAVRRLFRLDDAPQPVADDD